MKIRLDTPNCVSGKAWFPDQATADAQLKAIQQYRRNHGDEGRVPGRVAKRSDYCAACQGWHHIGTTSAGRRSSYNHRNGRRR